LAIISHPTNFTPIQEGVSIFLPSIMSTGFENQFDPFNNYFDHIYVITIEKAMNRRENLKPRLVGLDYEFFFGMDKEVLLADNELLNTVYDDREAKRLNRYHQPMNIGAIACSMSHCMVYRDMLQKGYRNALILEDDMVPVIEYLPLVPAILAELPEDWQVLYWGYDKNETFDFKAWTKQMFYHFLSDIGLLKWNKKMVKNLFAKKHSRYLKHAGYHDLTHAFSITAEAAKKLLEVQTPIVFNSDTAISYIVTNELIKGYITTPMIMKQEFQVSPDSYVSLIKD
jgi:glycosyl transferase family 25